MPDGTKIIIRNEDDAWVVLERALDGEFDDLDDISVELDGWPSTDMWLGAGKAAIYPGVMRGFLALQSGLHHSYGIIQNGDPSILRLTNEEKRFLEIVVHVDEGSSDYKVDWQKALHKVIERMSEKMEPKHWIGITCILGVLYFGTSGYKEYLQYQMETRKAEISAEEQAALFGHLQFMGAQETERMALLNRALDEISGLSGVPDQSDEAKKQVLQSLSQYGNLSVGGIDLAPDDVNEVLKRARSRSVERELTGEFLVLQVDTTAFDGFRVRLLHVESGVEFWARLYDALVSEPQRHIIQDAEWGKHALYGRVDVTQRGDKIVDAIIREVTEPEVDDIG